MHHRCNLGTGSKLQNMHFHNSLPRFFVSQEGKKLQILLAYMNLYFHKSFYYCQFRQKMLIYRYQQGRQANRFVLPCLRRRGTLARMAREKSSTGIYHVVFRGINRQIIFEDNQDRARFLDTLEEYKDICEFIFYGYCLMDNHVHLLIKETKESVSGIIKRICSSYVYWYNAKYKRCGHLFQERFKSETVETDGYFLTVLRYIHQNPIRAGIEKNVGEYRWSSYGEYITNSRIVDIDYALNYFSTDRSEAIGLFIEFMNADNRDECLEDVVKVKLTDEEVKKHIKQLGIPNPTAIQQLDKAKRNDILRKLKKVDGITGVQIARVTGLSTCIISRA